jgi:purine nucleosidase
LFCYVYPYGEIGRYLCEQTVAFSNSAPHPLGESWIMWDMAAVALLLDPHSMQYHERNAPRFNPDMTYVECGREHIIRVYDRIEPRFTLEDFYCKLKLRFDKNID